MANSPGQRMTAVLAPVRRMGRTSSASVEGARGRYAPRWPVVHPPAATLLASAPLPGFPRQTIGGGVFEHFVECNLCSGSWRSKSAIWLPASAIWRFCSAICSACWRICCSSSDTPDAGVHSLLPTRSPAGRGSCAAHHHTVTDWHRFAQPP